MKNTKVSITWYGLDDGDMSKLKGVIDAATKPTKTRTNGKNATKSKKGGK
ncbi:MAG: hypothetical protein NTU91_07615 [Chloroflexi bacterium]|jgi:hypothetical protein|nr:hypothetical protein [Chloroflexota bacterium]